MQLRTDGLIVRETNVGESDRIVTILTRERGVVRASARGSRTPKNRLASACRLLTFSRFTLFPGREKYIIGDAEGLEFFMGLREDLVSLALAQYFAELAGAAAPADEPAEAFLRLTLNALHLLEAGKRPPALLKAAYELRLLTLAGYMPDVVACGECGAYEHDVMYLAPATGGLVCADCLTKSPAGAYTGALPLSKGALAALRHAVLADFEKLFAFSLPAPALAELARASEGYLHHQLERTFTTLEFYNSVQK